MITQSFLYNAIFFTHALVLTKFYHVSNNAVPLYGFAFAVGNVAGPLLLGHLFDTLGRKKMISGTYLLSGALLAFSAWLFDAGVLHAAGQTFLWIVVFFFASAGAGAGYLTVSEIFPIEIRAEALAVFFASAQIVGAVGPALLRLAHRQRHQPYRAHHWLPGRQRHHDHRWDGGDHVRGQRRRQTPGGDRSTTPEIDS
jgi:MFS family permease